MSKTHFHYRLLPIIIEELAPVSINITISISATTTKDNEQILRLDETLLIISQDLIIIQFKYSK